LIDILITNMCLNGRTGTEAFVRDHALGLLRIGHRPMVYAPVVGGSVTTELSAAGIPVVTDLAALPRAPQVIHAHHTQPARAACAAFPDVPAIYVVRDALAWHDKVPVLPQIRRYVCVDEGGLARLYTEQIPDPLIRVIPNTVDLTIFLPRLPLPERPQRALVLSNYASEDTFLRPIREACASLGVPLDVAGAQMNTQTDTPEKLLPGYDIVFASGRAALEAAAVGAAVVLVDMAGVGGMLTSENLEMRLRWNLSGSVLLLPHEAGVLKREIEQYDGSDARAVSQVVRARRSLDDSLRAYIALYSEVKTEAPVNTRKFPVREITIRRPHNELVGTFTPPPKDVSYPLPPLYFLHVPKTAGSSFRAILSSIYPEHMVLQAQHWDQFFTFSPEQMRRYRLFMGHFQHFFLDYIAPVRPEVVTFLRDPASRVISRYKHMQRLPLIDTRRAGQNLSLLEYLRDPLLGPMSGHSALIHFAWDLDLHKLALGPVNLMDNAAFTAYLWELQGTLTDADYERMLPVALERMRNFAFVGVQERYGESLRLLSHRFGWPQIPNKVRINTAPASAAKPPGDEEMALIRHLTRYDQIIYDEAARLFDERVSKMAQQSQVVS
jgi:hypothetical protein